MRENFSASARIRGSTGKNSVANQMLKEQPQEPTGFIKLIETMVGQDAEVVRPQGITMLDYEPELVFVIGMRAHRVAKADAMRHVAGLTLVQRYLSAGNSKTRGGFRHALLDRQEHARLCADRSLCGDD